MVNPTKINVKQAIIFQQRFSKFLMILERLFYFEINSDIESYFVWFYQQQRTIIALLI